MPTFDKKFKKYHGCGVVRRTVAGGYVAEFNRDCRRRRKAFDTVDQATTWLDGMGVAREKKGDVVTQLSAAQLQDALYAFDHLERAGYREVSLFAVAEAYTKQAAASTKQSEVGTVAAWNERYMKHLAAPLDGGDPARPRTIKGKQRRLRQFIETHGTTEAGAVTAQDVVDWLTWTGATGRNLLNYKTEVQSLFNFIAKNTNGFINTVARFPQRKKKETPPAEILKPKQAATLLRELETLDSSAALAIALGCFAGLRTSEIVDGSGLQWSAVDFDQNIIRVPAARAKARKARDVKLTDNLLAWLQRYRFDESGKEHEGRIAPPEATFKRRKLEAAKSARIALVDNGARHSFGTYYGKLHGYRNASELMGHSGTMQIFEAHYKGLCTEAEAKAFFEIMPLAATGAKILKLGVA